MLQKTTLFSSIVPSSDVLSSLVLSLTVCGVYKSEAFYLSETASQQWLGWFVITGICFTSSTSQLVAKDSANIAK